MVVLEPKTIDPPRYVGTVRCQNIRCQAEYKPGNWWRGYSEGTTGNFIAKSKVREGCCPMCGVAQSDVK